MVRAPVAPAAASRYGYDSGKICVRFALLRSSAGGQGMLVLQDPIPTPDRSPSAAPIPARGRAAWFAPLATTRKAFAGGRLARGLVLAAAVALAGCQADEVGYGGGGAKANRPIAPSTLAKMRELKMSSASPILVRLFKQESELEVWKQGPDGKFALLKTYEICKWSGELGPKIKEGDRQAPEGFYTITPGLMNPNSSYHLAFNLGYPNSFDRSHGRTGSHLMVHGACSSRGCYAMEDKQIQDIYALARESFRGGQRKFQVQAYPFKMTPENLALHADNPNMPFWQMLKEGYDHFEVTRLEPKVDVCGRKYVFNATSADPRRGLDAARECPILDVPQEISIAVASKRQKDDETTRQIIAAAKAKRERIEENKARDLMIASAIDRTRDKAPGSRVPAVTPPADETPSEATQIMIASGVPLPVAAPGRAPSTAVAAAKTNSGGGWFGSVFSFTGGASDAAAAADAAPTQVAAVQPAPSAAPPSAAPAGPAAPAAAPAVAAAPTGDQPSAEPPSADLPTATAAAPAEAENGNFLSKAFGSLFGG